MLGLIQPEGIKLENPRVCCRLEELVRLRTTVLERAAQSLILLVPQGSLIIYTEPHPGAVTLGHGFTGKEELQSHYLI